MNDGMRLRRCVLFVPATRPERYPKALACGADMVCVDLEDAVAPDAKEEGRRHVVAWLHSRRPQGAEVAVRINSLKTEAGLRDVLMLCGAQGVPDAIVLPKVDSAEEVRWIEALLPLKWAGILLIPMVETAQGLRAAEEIALASPRVTALIFGGFDLSAELGCVHEWDTMLYARSRVVHAAGLAQIDAIDMPFLDVKDPDGLGWEVRAAARLGFSGKMAIHPNQVKGIQEAFLPTPEQLREAKEIVNAYEANRGGVLLVDGKLVERPVIRLARRMVAVSEAAECGESASPSGP